MKFSMGFLLYFQVEFRREGVEEGEGLEEEGVAEVVEEGVVVSNLDVCTGKETFVHILVNKYTLYCVDYHHKRTIITQSLRCYMYIDEQPSFEAAIMVMFELPRQNQP